MTVAAPPYLGQLPKIGLPPRLWTVKEFHDLGERGWFEGKRAKLIEGQIVEEGPMNPPHANAGDLAEDVIRNLFGRGWISRTQKPLVFDLWTDPLPDIAVMRGNPGGFKTHPTTADLIVEIADSSLGSDTTTKADLYATAGIKDYWVLDVDGKRLFVFRDPACVDGVHSYQTKMVLKESDKISPLALPSSSILVSELLPE